MTSIAQPIPLCSDTHLLVKKENTPLSPDINCVFEQNEYAYGKIQKLMDLAKLPMNFSVCRWEKLNNAVAYLDSSGNRFIYYDQPFLQKLDGDPANMESTTVLAHEIGHHLSGHTVGLFDANYENARKKYCQPGSADYDAVKCQAEEAKFLSLRRQEELEADRFAGFIMQRYGATYDQVAALFYKITRNYDDTMSTHPSLDKRLKAIREGYDLSANAQKDNREVGLEEIKGRKLSFKINNEDRVTRNRLMQKVHDAAFFRAMDIIRQENPGTSYGQGYSYAVGKQAADLQQYLGRPEINRLDLPDEFFQSGKCFYIMSDDPRITYGPVAGFHVKDGILKIVLAPETGSCRIVYRAPFQEDKISLDEIKIIFAEIYRDGFQKVINELK